MTTSSNGFNVKKNRKLQLSICSSVTRFYDVSSQFQSLSSKYGNKTTPFDTGNCSENIMLMRKRYLIDKGSGTVTDSEILEKILHIRSMKDVRTLTLAPNPALKAKTLTSVDLQNDVNAAGFICPISGLEMNGKARFLMNWACGCVLSDRAVKEVAKEGFCCRCSKPCTPEDLIQINGTLEEVELYRQRMTVRREAKKGKKNKKAAMATGSEAEVIRKSTTSGTGARDISKSDSVSFAESDEQEAGPSKTTNLVKPEDGGGKRKESKTPEAVFPNDDEGGECSTSKKRKSTDPTTAAVSHKKLNHDSIATASKSVVKSTPVIGGKALLAAAKASSSTGKIRDKSGDKSFKTQPPCAGTGNSSTGDEFSIQQDPRASKVLKSLFTTSDKGKQQQHAHWVTYNPFYN